MSRCDRKRQGALILISVAILLVGLVVSAEAGVKVNVGDSRDQYERFLAETEKLSPESARKLTAYVERTSHSRIIDEWEVPSGTIIDYYHVGRQKPGGPQASYNGSAVVVGRNSRLGQAYLRKVYAELSAIERVNKWLGDIFAPNNHMVLVPVGLLEPGQMTQMVTALAGATETRKIAIVGAEFPPWDNRSPDQGASAWRAGFSERYWSAHEVWDDGRQTFTPLPEQQIRAYPMYMNLDVDFSGAVEGNELTYQTPNNYPPDWYADATGGPITVYSSGQCNPEGLHNTAWEGTASETMPPSPDWYTIELSNRTWTEFELQNAWWNLLFNRSNANSLTNYYYENSHGKITIEGDRSDIIGWVRSAHVLDRHSYGRNWLYAQQPGTPIIRPFLVIPGDPQYGQRIVRASLDEHALTALFAEDSNGGPVELYAYQQDLNGITSGDQPGYTRIYGPGGASLGDDHYVDVYDSRRHQWVNSGWQYRRSSSSSPGYTYVDFDAVYAARADWYMTVGNYRWGRPGGPPTGGNPTPSNWGTAYPLAPNEPGMGFTPYGWMSVYTRPRAGARLYNTTFETADVYATSAQDTQAWVVHEGYNPLTQQYPNQELFGNCQDAGYGVDYGMGNRLKTFWYYHHDHQWSTGKPTYQVEHLRNAANAVDDIAGTSYTSNDRAPRPYPFNSDGSDSANQGFGFRPGGAGHDADAMVADINLILQDNGINPTGYHSIAYLFPDGTSSDHETVTGRRMIPRCAGYVLLPESCDLTLRLAAHEFGHCLFGFVDLYDQDFYNNYMTTTPPNPSLKECLALGPYSVMAKGVRVDAWHKIGGSKNNPASMPPSAPVDWVSELVVTEDRLNLEVPQIEGTLRDPVILKLSANPYDILKFWDAVDAGSVDPSDAAAVRAWADNNWEEYFLVENRYQVGPDYFGDASPQGLYVYHIDDRNIRYVPRSVSVFQVEERALSVAMVQADGKMELESNTSAPSGDYLAGDPFPGEDNVRWFSQIPKLLDPNDPEVGQRWSPTSSSHGDVIDSGPLGTVVIKSGTPTDSFMRVVNISNPSTTMTADVFVKPREIIVTNVSHDPNDESLPHPDYPDIYDTLAHGADLVQGDRLQGVLALKLDNPQYVPGSGDFSKMSTGEVVVNSVKILESGTAEQNEDEDHPGVERAYLYAETSDPPNGLQTSGANADSRIGSATFGNYDPYLQDNVADYAVFTSLGFRVPPDASKVIYVVYDILDEAQINPEITIGAELTDYTFITPAAPGAVCVRQRLGGEWEFGNYYFPMVSATSVIVEKPDVLEVTPNPPDPGAGTVAPDSISQGAADVPLLQLRMHATDDAVIVKEMRVDATSGAGWINALEDLNVIRLYVDNNRNGLIDGVDDLLAEANFGDVGGVPQALLQLDDVEPISLRTIPYAEAPEDDKYWLLSVDMEDEAPVGAQVQIRLEAADYITLVTNPSHPPAQQDTVSPLNFTEDENGDPLPSGTLVKSQPSTVIEPNALPNPPDAGFEPAEGFQPPDGRISDRTPVFRWEAATDNPTDPTDPATADDPSDLYYEIELATDATMTNIIWSADTQANLGTTTITLPASEELPDPGDATVDYYWQLRTVDTDGGRSDASIILCFHLIGNQAPTAPLSGFWPHGSPVPLQITDTTPTYRWDHGSDPDANDTFDTLLYYVQVADNTSFAVANRLVDQDDVPVPAGTTDTDPVTFNPYDPPYSKPALTVGVTYYWRVMTKDAQGTYSNQDANGDPDWSAVSVQQFEVVENRKPATPADYAGTTANEFQPSNGDEVNSARPTITWRVPEPPDPDESDTLETLRFYVQIKDAANVSEGPYITELTTTAADVTGLTYDPAIAGTLVSKVVDVDLQDDTQYWYRVRARDLNGTGLYSDWSAIQNFWVNTENDAPLKPTSGFSPANGTTVNDSTPDFAWSHSEDPDHTDNSSNLYYILQLSKVGTSQADFAANLAYQYTSNVGQNWLTATEALDDLTTWYWRVQAVDDSGAASEFSDIQNFYLDTENEDPVLSEGYPDTYPDRYVNPRYGSLATFYEYRVTYRDAEGDAPGWVQVTLDAGVVGSEQTLPMAAINPVDPDQNDFRNGVVYAVGIAGADLGYGAHTWVFATQNSARLPETPPDTGAGATVGSVSTLRLADKDWNDTDQYEETATVYIEIDDQDENLDPTFRESIQVLLYVGDPASPSDVEVVTLREQNTNDGIFRGELPIYGAQGPANDATTSNGQLNVIAGASGAQIGAYYLDKDDDPDGDGNIDNPDPDEQTASATVVDTEAPDRVNFPTDILTATSGPHGRSVDLDWSGYNEADQIDVAGYSVYYGENDFGNTGDPNAQLYAQVTAGSQTITVDGLTPNTTYYFAVVAYDEVPNPSGAAPVATEALITRDTTAPAISNLSPADGATEVALDTNISCRLTDTGSGVDVDTLDVKVEVGGTEVGVDVDVTDEGTYLQVDIDPDNDFAWNDTVTVSVTVSDVDGNEAKASDTLANPPWDFAVLADTTPPAVEQQSPADGADDVAVSTPISFHLTDNKSGVDVSTLNVTFNGQDITADVTTSQVDENLDIACTYTPPEDLLYNSTYTVTVTVSDFADRSSGTIGWSFDTVNDDTGVTVEPVQPERDAENVRVDTNISIRLTDTQAGVNPDSIRLWINDTEVSDDIVKTVEGDSVLVEYDPPQNLAPQTDIFVKVYVEDKVPVPNPTEMTYKFTTGLLYTISGQVTTVTGEAIADVTITCDGQTTTTDADGAYTLMELLGGTYTVTPSKGGATFDPASQQVTVGPDATGVDFLLVTSTISGRVTDADGAAVVGVDITCQGETTGGEAKTYTKQTDGNGYYLLTGVIAGDYAVTPAKAEWTFDPPSHLVSVGPGQGDATDVNFVGTLTTYSISGRVVDRDGNGVAGVRIGYDGASVATDANGDYVISGVRRGQYTLTPALQYYHFEPVNRVVAVTNSDVTGQNFTAVADTFTISGTVYDGVGRRLQGVEVTAGPSAAITNTTGGYTLTNVAMGTHAVTAARVGYKVVPDQIEVTVPPDYTGADFTAYFELSNSFPAGVNLLGVPGTPIDRNPQDVFGTTQVARWDPSAEPPAYMTAAAQGDTDFMRVRPGSGYFVRLANTTDLSIAGEPTDTSRPVNMGIGTGWNMIANPFASSTPFVNFQPTVADGIRPYAFVYNNSSGSYELISYRPSINAKRDNLQPWEGAWILCLTGGCSLTISSADTATAAVVKPQQVETGSGYIMPVIATAGGRSDTCSVAGVIPGAGAEHTLLNPPTAPATVDVYFVNDKGQCLSRDIRDQSSGADSYEFVVSCGVGAADVRVMLPDLSTVPPEYEVMLTDVDADKTMYARTMPVYSYRSGEGTTLRNFRLEVRPRSVGSLTIATASAVQQSGSATITYSVSQRCQVNMIVRNMAGRCVKVLATDKVVSAGVNPQVWDLSNDAGAKVPSGPYLIEIGARADNGQQARALARINVRR